MRPSRFQIAILLIVGFVGPCLDFPSEAFGQVFRGQISSMSGSFIEAPRGILSTIRQAKDAIKEGRVNEAIVELGDIASRQSQSAQSDDLVGQDFFIDFKDATEGAPVNASLMRSVRQMIGELPKNGLETYELRYGPIARKELDAAALNRDWSQFELVRRRYFHTLAGYEASYLLAKRQMYAGHPLHASLLLDDVTSHARALDHLGASAFLLHASACFLAGRELPPTDWINAQDVSLNPERTLQSKDDLVAWIEQNIRLQENFQAALPLDHAIFGAQPDRNGMDIGQMPLSQARWRLPTSSTPRQTRAIEVMEDELASNGQLPPPSWVPLKVGDQLIMRTTELLLGVDYETGKRLWVKPWESGFEPQEDDEASFDEMSDDGQRNQSLRQRIWNDAPYGHVSSDGKRVFMLADLSSMRATRFGMLQFQGLRPADVGSNTLYALDVESEGKLLWKLGKGGDDASPFSDAFFLGVPLPIDGLLYVMVEVAGDINLCCLDPNSGNEVWRQHLVATESGGIQMDPIRRSTGAMPTYHEGVLICPTGTGVTVAVDLADRSLRWGAVYPRAPVRSRPRANRFGVANDQSLQRWDLGVAVADKASVLLTPPETDKVYCFDLVNGKKRFAERPRMKMRYLAGIRDGKYLLVGSSRVRAFDLETGAEVWSSPTGMLSPGQQISGRGVFGKNDYLVPTSTSELIRLSLQTGEILQRRNTRYRLGNLVAVENDLIIQSPTTLSVAYGEQSLQPIVDRMLQENPNDFKAIVHKSELLIEKGLRREALDLLRRARELDPNDHAVRSLSVTAMLSLLRDDPKAGEEYVQAATELIEQPSHWIELLALRAKGSIDRQEYVDATKRLIEMSSRLLEAGELDGLSDSLNNDPSRSCTLDSWIAARMHDLRSMVTADQHDEIEKLVEANLKLKSYFSSPLLTRLRRHFEAWDSVAILYPVLFEKYKRDKDWLAIERMLIGSRVYPMGTMDSLSDLEIKLLSQSYTAAELFDDAAKMLEVYLQRHQDSTSTLSEIAERRDQLLQKAPPDSWSGEVKLKDWQSRNDQIYRRRVQTAFGETVVEGGGHFAGWRVTSDSNTKLSIRNAVGTSRWVSGETLLRGSAVNNAKISGSALVAITTDSMFCVDLNQYTVGQNGLLRWQRHFSGDGNPIAKRVQSRSKFGGSIYRNRINSSTAANTPELVLGPVLGDRVVYLQGGDLLAIDLMTKEVLWRNSDAPVQGAVLVAGDQVAVVSDNTHEIAFFNLHDGRKLSKRPWMHGVIWGFSGKHVLSYADPDRLNKQFEIRLYDPFADEIVLHQTSRGANRSQTKAPAAYGQIVSGRYLAWMQTDGQALIWDILEGRAIGAPAVPSYDDLKGLHVIELKDKFVFLPSRKAKNRQVELIGHELVTQSGQAHRSANAAIAFDSKTGETLWKKDFDRPWGTTITQVYGTPLLAFVRSQNRPTLNTQPRRKHLDVMFLSVDDGREVYRKEKKEINLRYQMMETRMIVQPQIKEVVAYIGVSDALFFKFED